MKKVNREILCACGCGQKLLEYSKQYRKRSYIKGHSNKGKTLSNDIKKKISIANTGNKHTESAKLKMSIARKGRVFSVEHRRKIGEANKKRVITEETKKKISVAKIGKKHTPESILKMSGENHPNFGKKRSAESILKISEKLKGRTISTETRKKMSKSSTGKKHTTETKQKMSGARKGLRCGEENHRFGIEVSKETREKMSRAHKGLMIGDKNPMWNGGTSFEPYCPKFNENFKEKIRDLFNRRCFLCEKTEETNGRRLSVHHVNYNKNCGCDDTLKCDYVPLCASCHGKTSGGNRKEWENVISQKLHRLSL